MDFANLFFFIWYVFRKISVIKIRKLIQKTFLGFNKFLGGFNVISIGFIQFFAYTAKLILCQILLNMKATFLISVCFTEVRIMKQIRKWPNMSLLRVTVLKTVLVKEFVRIWSIAVVVFHVALGDLFIVRITLFL